MQKHEGAIDIANKNDERKQDDIVEELKNNNKDSSSSDSDEWNLDFMAKKQKQMV